MRRLALVAAALALGGCGSSDGGPAPGVDGTAAAATPLSVEEAIAAGGGELLVRGYVIANVDEYRLCEKILESHPPQCGEPSLLIENVEFPRLRTLMDTQKPVTMLGLVDDRVIRVHSVRG